MSFLEDFKKIDDTIFYPIDKHSELLPSDSGTHYIIAPGLNHYSIQLPPPTQKGMKFMFTKGDATNAFQIGFVSYKMLFTGTIIRGKNDNLIGSYIEISDNVNCIYLQEDAVVGDFIQMIADGTSWVVIGCSNATVNFGFDTATLP